ncbi:hypothetical protein FRC00_013467 [Tulasnella sp. 408]|nr:hypothetical protein FRC00_013467 [Tulasnella sp. 408]
MVSAHFPHESIALRGWADGLLRSLTSAISTVVTNSHNTETFYQLYHADFDYYGHSNLGHSNNNNTNDQDHADDHDNHYD